ncbi:MAG: glycosyltransferase family 39 protein [Verrucomicrobiota bacterium]
MPLLKKTLIAASFLLIILGGLSLRLQNADTRQMHVDESVQAYQTWKLEETGEYKYDPVDKHGPTLYYLSSWFSPFLTEDGVFTGPSLRRFSIFFSLLSLVLIIVWNRHLGVGGSLIAGALIAFAPLQIIYGAYYVQEASFAFLSLAFSWAAWKASQSGGAASWIILGLLAGLMFSTKETSLIHFAALFPLVVFGMWRNRKAAGASFWAAGLISLTSFLAVSILFFSTFFADFSGVSDAFGALFGYVDRAGGQGHEKASAYYLQIFLPHTSEGVYWSELIVLLLSLTSFVHWLTQLSSPRSTVPLARDVISIPLPVFIGLSGIVMFLIYTAIPYKTPWLMLTPQLFIFIGTGFSISCGIRKLYQKLPNTPKMLSFVLIILGLTVAKQSYGQVQNACLRYHSDARNPYIYEHTNNPFARLLNRLEDMDTLIGNSTSIAVFSPDNAWPLPWYLKERDRVAYQIDLSQLGKYDLEIVDSRLADGIPASYYDQSISEIHGLRPNTHLFLQIKTELWDEYMALKSK